LETASADADRARRLIGGGSLSQQQVAEYLSTERQAQASLTVVEAQLESARLDLANTRILAVSGGTLSSRSAALGDVVAQGEELFRLIRDNRIEWQVEVPLMQLPSVSVGMAVSIPSPTGAPVTGTVRRIAPTASEDSGRVLVYVELDGDASTLPFRTGMLVSGALRIDQTEAVTVPAPAIVMRDGFSYVFTVDDSDPAIVSRIRVETGRRIGDRVELLGDFDRAVRIVQSGGAFLSDGSAVSVVDGGTRE
jgi:RND family efflux transporter MFP subunit